MRVIYFLVCFLSMTSCTQTDVNIAGDYYISRGDHDHVYIFKRPGRGNQNVIVVDQQVVDYAVVGDYIVVLRKIAESYDCYDESDVPTIITFYSDDDEFWVIDYKNGREIGPLVKTEYVASLRALGLPMSDLSAPSSYESSQRVRDVIDKCVKDKNRKKDNQ